MSVDASTVPPSIYSVDFYDGNNNAAIWTEAKKARNGTITGAYLTGGHPQAVDSNGKAIKGIDINPVSKAESYYPRRTARAID